MTEICEGDTDRIREGRSQVLGLRLENCGQEKLACREIGTASKLL